MQIEIDVEQSAEGRLSGTIRMLASGVNAPFSGILELVTRIEELCRVEATVLPVDERTPSTDA